VFGDDKNGTLRQEVAREVAKPAAADHIGVCKHLGGGFASNHTITLLPRFSRLADAGMTAMDLVARSFQKDSRVQLTDVVASVRLSESSPLRERNSVMLKASPLALAAAVALTILMTAAEPVRAGYFAPSPGAIPSYRFARYATYNPNPLAFHPSYLAPSLYFRASTAAPIFDLPANYPTTSFNTYGSYGSYSSYTFGPPYDFAWPGDVTFYPYGTTYSTTLVEPYYYTGPYVGPLLYRP
jgi:hypothetical protein